MNRRDFVMLAATTAVIAPKGSSGAEPIPVTLYKNPECSCCESYAHYLGENGFKVDVRSTNDLAEISRKELPVPGHGKLCQTSILFVLCREGRMLHTALPLSLARHCTEPRAICGRI